MRDWNGWVREQLSLPEMKDHHEERVITELADHLEDFYSEAVSGGASPEEAEALVVQELGDREAATRELIRSEPAHRRKEVDRRVERAEELARQKGGGGLWWPMGSGISAWPFAPWEGSLSSASSSSWSWLWGSGPVRPSSPSWTPWSSLPSPSTMRTA